MPEAGEVIVPDTYVIGATALQSIQRAREFRRFRRDAGGIEQTQDATHSRRVCETCMTAM
jgi:hypothetical protein